MTPSVLELARRLLACPSVTPESAGAVELVTDLLTRAGFSADVETTPNGTTNAWLTHGTGAPVFAFAGHVDVVPPGDRALWRTDPFTPTVEDGRLYGRGAADMKGSVAAAAVALARFVAAHPDHPGTVALLLTSDEEGDGLEGTMRVVETLKARGVHLTWCIVGEPSSATVFGDTIKNGRRGSLNARVVVEGVQGHVAYPALCRNPVHLAAPVLAELAQRVWDAGDEHFPPTSFQISNIRAGTGTVNVVPGTCEILFNLRYSPVWTAARLRAEIEQVFARHGVQARFTWQESAFPFLTPAGSLSRTLSEAIERECGVTPVLSTSGGTSDARFLSKISDETVEFGPINATIHSANECVGVDELERLARIDEAVLTALL